MPAVVVACSGPRDVADAVGLARRRGLPLAVRGGGHSYAGHSSTDGVLILTHGLNSLALQDDLLTVGSGQTLGGVSDFLARHGRLLPSGSCPTVGVAGIALAGGFGWRGRLHGLTTDQVVAVSIVLADGSLCRVSATGEPELFWALRGGGAGSFGVVTSLTLRTHPLAPLHAVHAVHALHAVHAGFPLPEAVDVIDRWQRHAHVLPDSVTLEVALTAPDHADEPVAVELFGVAPDRDLLSAALDALDVVPLAPSLRWFGLDAGAAARYLAGRSDRRNEAFHQPPDPIGRPPFLYVKSEYFRRHLPRDTIAALVENFAAQRVYGEYRDLEFTPWGGAYARVAPEATAFPHRDPLFMVSHTVLAGANAPAQQRASAKGWLRRSWELLRPFGCGGVYPGYPDPDLDAWALAYYGANLDRLSRAKSAYDPANLFRHAQSVPPAGAGVATMKDL
ncbi:MAG TPA: FAD-binding oxidoreductase [Candidatus Limnocylindrales bacterium]